MAKRTSISRVKRRLQRKTGAQRRQDRPHSPPPPTLFQRNHFAMALAAALVPVSVGHAREGYKPNSELFLLPTDERFLGGAAGLLPLTQSKNRLTFSELRLTFSDEETEEYNLLLGHRLLDTGGTIWGGYIAYDRRESANNNTFDQVGVGVELLSPTWDFRANYYDPLDDEELIGPNGTGGNFQGHKLFANFNVEEPLEGFDFEVGRVLGFLPMETRLYAGGYRYESDFAPQDANGYQVRAELRPLKSVLVGASFKDDNLFDDEFLVEIRYQFGYEPRTGVRTQHERMTGFVRRDVDIRVTEPEDAEAQGVVSNNVVHIDNTNDGEGGDGVDNGDGSFENPYNRFQACDAPEAGCTVENALIYVHSGDGTSTGYDVPVELLNGQQLIGQGFNLFGIGGDAFPQVSATGPVVTLADSNEVAGLEIEANSPAIVGYNATGFNIHHNRLFNGGVYINTYNDTNSGRIANNYIYSGGYGTGIQLNNFAYGGGTSEQSVRLSNNVVLGGSYGLHARNGAGEGAGSLATQNITFTGLNLMVGGGEGGEGSANAGARFESYAQYQSESAQNVALSGQNVFFGIDRDASGLSAENRAEGNDGVATQEFTGGGLVSAANIYDSLGDADGIAPGAISLGNGDGLGLWNVADAYGTASQDFDVQGAAFNLAAAERAAADIPVTGDGVLGEVGGLLSRYGHYYDSAVFLGTRSGVAVGNQAYNPGAQATQSVTLDNASVIAGARDGLLVENSAYGGGEAEQSVAVTDIGYGVLGVGRQDGNGYGTGVRLRNRDFGVYGANSTSALQDVTLSGGGSGADGVLVQGTQDGLLVENDARYGHAEQDVALQDVYGIFGSDGDGVWLENSDLGSSGAVGTATQNVEIAGDNVLVAGKYAGLGARNEAFGGQSEQSLTLSGGAGIYGKYNGVDLRNRDYGYGSTRTAIQDVDLGGEGLVIGGDYGTGLRAENFAVADGHAEQYVSVSGVSEIYGRTRGVFLRNEDRGSGGMVPATAIQEVDLAGDGLRIEGAYTAGVAVENSARNDGHAEQTVGLSGVESIYSQYGDGVLIENSDSNPGRYLYPDGFYPLSETAIQQVSIEGDGLEIAGGGEGIAGLGVYNVGNYGTAEQTVDVSGVSSVSGRDGVLVGNVADGRYGSATQDVSVQGDGVQIDGIEDGIYSINEATAGTAEQTVTIGDVVGISSGNNGVYLANDADGSYGGTATQDFVLSGDALAIESGRSGIVGANRADDSAGATATQNLEVTGLSSIDFAGEGGSYYSGVRLFNAGRVADETAIQNAIISGDNLAIRGFREGVLAENDAISGGVAEQDLEVTGLGVVQVDDVGIVLDNEARYGSDATQAVNIQGGDIQADGDGVLVYNEAVGVGDYGTQDVTLADITADGVGGYGLYINNDSNVAGNGEQSVDLSPGGNTIINSGASYDVYIYNFGVTGSQTVDLTGDNNIGSVEDNDVGNQTVTPDPDSP